MDDHKFSHELTCKESRFTHYRCQRSKLFLGQEKSEHGWCAQAGCLLTHPICNATSPPLTPIKNQEHQLRKLVDKIKGKMQVTNGGYGKTNAEGM